MALKIKGINTGVIHDASHFSTLALKIISQKNEQFMFFIPARSLRDLLVCFEYRLNLQNLCSDPEKNAFRKRQDKSAKALLENIPPLERSELEQADINWRVEEIELQFSRKEEMDIVFRLKGTDTFTLTIEDSQIALLLTAITRAISSAGMDELSLRLASLLDFLPLYDADYQADDKLNYDTYTHPAWKLPLFNHTLALAYRYIDDQGEERCAGTVIKARVEPNDKAAEAIARRLLAFSPRLKKLEGRPSQVSVRTLSTQAEELTCSQSMRALWQLHQEVLAAADNTPRIP